MNRINPGYELKTNYEVIFGDWNIPLENLTKSNYMYNLMIFLFESYKTDKIRPNRTDIFKAFKETKFSELKVVILGQDPYPNYNSTGLAFANPNRVGDTLSPSLQKIKNCVLNNYYRGEKTTFDPTLESWAKQGVLLLNSSLSVKFSSPNSHSIYWKEFTRQTISAINEWKNGIIFLLWGSQAGYFKKYINTKRHYVFEYFHPSLACRQNHDWNCPHFQQTNLILEKNYGKEMIINW